MDETAGGFDAAWFAAAAGGELQNGNDTPIGCVVTDSRTAGPATLFVALPGERVDGHDFVSVAATAGAPAVLVSRRWYEGTGRSLGLPSSIIIVEDPLAALQQAARCWRRRFPALLRLAVTGSSGKTTTKEILAAIIGNARVTIRSPGNLNSDIGLPSAIFGLRSWHEVAVFELGINRPGEMALLADIYEPDCAVITTIGTAHIGKLGGTKAAIAAEKKQIAARFNGTQHLIVAEDDEFRDFMLRDIQGTGFLHGPRSVEGFAGARDLGQAGWIIDYAGIAMHLALPGPHNLRNALAAIRAAALYGASPTDVQAGLAAVQALPGRMEILHGGFTIVNDCYNANLESMLAALSFCDETAVPGRRLYVLGSMKELGDETQALHASLGTAAAHSAATFLFFYGDEATVSARSASAAGSNAVVSHHHDFDALASAVLAEIRPGDLVLLKASHSMGLEHLTALLRNAGGFDVS